MQATQQEAASVPSAYNVARRAERDGTPATDLGRYRWLMRGLGALIAGVCAAVVSVAHVAVSDAEFYLITSIVFLNCLLFSFALVAHSRKTHVGLERRYRARLFIRNLELQDMAMRDDLTQLFNRRYFFERLRRELDRARSDIPARLGGDEFGVIMPETDKDGAFAVAKRLQRALDVTPVYEQDGDSLKMNVSLGVSGFPWGGDSVDEVVQWADTHMYAAKTSHKNNPDPLSSARERLGKKV
jgi:GGDEF domain-containing protein